MNHSLQSIVQICNYDQDQSQFASSCFGDMMSATATATATTNCNKDQWAEALCKVSVEMEIGNISAWLVKIMVQCTP